MATSDIQEVIMDQIVRLNGQQEAALDDAADRFIALHHGNVRKALKEMMVLNGHLNDQIGQMARARPGSRTEAGSQPGADTTPVLVLKDVRGR